LPLEVDLAGVQAHPLALVGEDDKCAVVVDPAGLARPA
jgi:hypothetical protein